MKKGTLQKSSYSCADPDIFQILLLKSWSFQTQDKKITNI